MNILQDEAYFASRAEKSRALALSTADPGIRRIHSERAKRYEDLARRTSLQTHPPRT